MVVERKTIDRSTRGKLAETSARDALLREGLKQVAANVNYRGGELDLVMLDSSGREGDTLVFVEVRYRSSNAFGGGAASVDAGKQRRLVRAAQAYLLRHPRHADAPCRFDVIAASGDPAAPAFDWLRDAFRADEG